MSALNNANITAVNTIISEYTPLYTDGLSSEEIIKLNASLTRDMNAYLDSQQYSYYTYINRKFNIRNMLASPMELIITAEEWEEYFKRRQESLTSRKRINITVMDVDKLRRLKDNKRSSPGYEKNELLYLQYVCGRRIGEMYNGFSLSGGTILYKPLKKGNLDGTGDDKWITVNGERYQEFTLLSGITPPEFIDRYNNIAPWIKGHTLKNLTRKMNRHIKTFLGDNYTTHTLRALYGDIKGHEHNGSTTIGIQNALNHSNSASVVHYDHVSVEKLPDTHVVCHACSKPGKPKIIMKTSMVRHGRSKLHMKNVK